MTPKYTITAARSQDVTQLPAIELAAARLLVGFAPKSVLNETTSLAILEQAQREERLWVALGDDVPVGFAHLEVIERDAIHLQEIDVHPNHGRRGLGTKLICHVCDWATGKGYGAVTLTTFRDVPWNLPFYSRVGFSVVPPEQVSASLRAIVEDETCRGLDPSRRVVMKRELTNPARLFGDLHVMNTKVIQCQDDADCESLGSWLADRIYEFNSKATGYFDGLLLGGCIRNDAGDVIAGFHGYTWGGCCELSHVWVDKRYRGRGLGAVLLRSAEAEAVARGCAQVVLATHSFQAPGFYERMGYERQYTIQDRPKGYTDIIYAKVLQA